MICMFINSVATTQVVLQFVDLKLKVGLVQCSVHEEVVPAVVEQLDEGEHCSAGPECYPPRNDEEVCSNQREKEGRAEGDLVSPKCDA